MIQCSTRENDAHIEVALSGMLTTCEAKDAFDYVQPLWQQPKEILVNLAGVTDLDWAGFQILVYWKVQAAARQHTLHFVKHSAQVLAALNLFGAVASGASA